MSMCLCAGLATSVARATPPEPLDTDFLDYLAQCEGKEDNWTVVANGKERKKATPPRPEKPAAQNVDTKPADAKQETKP